MKQIQTAIEVSYKSIERVEEKIQALVDQRNKELDKIELYKGALETSNRSVSQSKAWHERFELRDTLKGVSLNGEYTTKKGDTKNYTGNILTGMMDKTQWWIVQVQRTQTGKSWSIDLSRFKGFFTRSDGIIIYCDGDGNIGGVNRHAYTKRAVA